MDIDNTKYDAFLKTLHPKLSKKYKGLQKNYYSESKNNFEKNIDDFIDKIELGIKTDKEHRDLINLCVFPFSNVQSDVDLNYRFIRGEPLWELEKKSFDFLLCHFEKKFVIFGECKASIQNYSDVVKELELRQKIVLDNIDYIIENYLGFEPKNIKYVIGVYSSDDEELIKKIIERNSDFIVWSIDRYKKLLSFKSFLNISETQKRKIEHDHTKLNNKLKKIPTDTGGYDMFPSSHIITRLRQIILTKEKKQKDLIVSPSKIKSKVKNDIFYLNETIQTDIASRIINYAEKIGFIEPIDENSIEYRIISNYRHESGLEKDLINKFINFKIKEKEMEIFENSHTNAMEIIKQELKMQYTLDKF
ncbi:Uncharacterised protein [uncultured archaeon]|nr:Uncharacterised protein [uncultured archaeon]